MNVVATAGTWSRVWGELAWLDEEGDERAGAMLSTLVDRTPPGVEDLEDSEEASYGVELLLAEKLEIQRLTGVRL